MKNNGILKGGAPLSQRSERGLKMFYSLTDFIGMAAVTFFIFVLWMVCKVKLAKT